MGGAAARPMIRPTTLGGGFVEHPPMFRPPTRPGPMNIPGQPGTLGSIFGGHSYPISPSHGQLNPPIGSFSDIYNELQKLINSTVNPPSSNKDKDKNKDKNKDKETTECKKCNFCHDKLYVMVCYNLADAHKPKCECQCCTSSNSNCH